MLSLLLRVCTLGGAVDSRGDCWIVRVVHSRASSLALEKPYTHTVREHLSAGINEVADSLPSPELGISADRPSSDSQRVRCSSPELPLCELGWIEFTHIARAALGLPVAVIHHPPCTARPTRTRMCSLRLVYQRDVDPCSRNQTHTESQREPAAVWPAGYSIRTHPHPRTQPHASVPVPPSLRRRRRAVHRRVERLRSLTGGGLVWAACARGLTAATAAGEREAERHTALLLHVSLVSCETRVWTSPARGPARSSASGQLLPSPAFRC